MNSRPIGLKWKIGGVYAAILLILGALVMAAVYQIGEQTLRSQLDRHQIAIVTSFSDSVAGHLASKNALAVHVLASKYALLDGNAYTLVRDSAGAIVAHSFGVIPDAVRALSRDASPQVQRRDLTLSGKRVREDAVPILDGQLGIVHVGFWADAGQAEMRQAWLSLLTLVGVIYLSGVVLSFALAHWIVRPISRLSTIAEKITRGDLDNLDLGYRITSRDEIGALASSLERMRSSLKAALSRLAREVS